MMRSPDDFEAALPGEKATTMRERAGRAIQAKSNDVLVGRWLRRGRSLAAAAMMGALAATSMSVIVGCAVNEKDIDRWTTTEHGPEKLYAVVTHSKYAWDLRSEAAMALVRTRPRDGDYVGLRYLVDGIDLGEGQKLQGALAAVPDDARKRIVADMTPQLVEGMKLRPPPRQDVVLPDGTKVPAKCTLPPPDPSIPYKDAAFAMINSTNPPLVTDEKNLGDLTAALMQWVQTDFEARIDNVNQEYATETVMRKLGKGSVSTLPDLIKEDTTKLERIVGLIADLGDDATKAKAANQLVTLAKQVDSKAWLDAHTKQMTETCKGKKIADVALTQKALEDQAQRLESLFGYMNRLGGRPVLDYALSIAHDRHDAASTEMRKNALAAIKGIVFKDPKDPKNGADADMLIDIIKDPGANQQVRLLAAQRLLEASPELLKDGGGKSIVQKLYALFDASDDKRDVRFVAGWTILQAVGMNGVDEFMRHLPQKSDQKMTLSEAIGYGQTITDLLDPKKTIKVDKTKQYLTSGGVGPKLAALGGFFEEKNVDVNLLKPVQSDQTPVPKCDESDKCGWTDPGCWVPKAPGSKEMEKKVITTVGDFVSYCILPNVNK